MKSSIRGNQSLGDNIELARRESGQQLGKLSSEQLDALIKATATHGFSKQELATAKAFVTSVAQQNSPNTEVAQKLLAAISRGRAAQGSLKRLWADIHDKFFQKGTLPTTAWQDKVPSQPEIDRWKQQIGKVQQSLLRGNDDLQQIDRGFHQKQLFGGLAELELRSDLPESLRFGPFKPSADGSAAKLKAAVRFSNGQGCPFMDSAPDVRGVAIKLLDQEGESWDILATNKQTFARDAEQFMKFAEVNAVAQTTGENLPGALAFVAGQGAAGLDLTAKLLKSAARKGLEKLGGPDLPEAEDWDTKEALRVATTLSKDTVLHRPDSLATESYDGGTFRTPEGHLAKILLEPRKTAQATETDRDDPNYLSQEFTQQLAQGPVSFEVKIKLYTGNGDPTEAHDPWNPSRSYTLGTLNIKAPENEKLAQQVNKMAFNPARGFSPAQMTHARDEIYAESAKNRGAMAEELSREVIKES